MTKFCCFLWHVAAGQADSGAGWRCWLGCEASLQSGGGRRIEGSGSGGCGTWIEGGATHSQMPRVHDSVVPPTRKCSRDVRASWLSSSDLPTHHHRGLIAWTALDGFENARPGGLVSVRGLGLAEASCGWAALVGAQQLARLHVCSSACSSVQWGRGGYCTGAVEPGNCERSYDRRAQLLRQRTAQHMWSSWYEMRALNSIRITHVVILVIVAAGRW